VSVFIGATPLKSLVPEAGLEPTQRLAPPDFEYLKPSKLYFFNMMKILSILYVLNTLGHTYFQIQSDANGQILKPMVAIQLHYSGGSGSGSLPPEM
jgi:hypothetical protein